MSNTDKPKNMHRLKKVLNVLDDTLCSYAITKIVLGIKRIYKLSW